MRKSNLGYLIITVCLFPFTSIRAQSIDLNENFETDPKVGLETITIPFFPQLPITSEYASFLSWISFIFGLVVLLIVVYWIYRIMAAAIKAMGAGDNQDQLTQSVSDIKNVIVSFAMTMVVPVALVIIGAALGLGAIWDWPLAFRSCNSAEYEYYFQAFASLPDKEAADLACFGEVQ